MSQNIETTRVNGRIGAVVSGIKLGADLPDETVHALLALMHEHKVLVFREQHDFDAGAMSTFAGRLGGKVVTATYPNPPTQQWQHLKPADESENVLVFGTAPIPIANHWHTDLTYALHPPAVGILRPIVLPSVGGDTCWANTAAAYKELPVKMREFCDGLRVLHSNIRGFVSPYWIGAQEWDYTSPVQPEHIHEAIHSLVRVHPHSGERCLMVGSFARHVPGFASPSLSDELIRTLQWYITRPDNTMRWQWKLGDVAMFDNRTTQHYGVYDYTEKRLVQRVSTIDMEVPVGVDGFRSIRSRTSKAAQDQVT